MAAFESDEDDDIFEHEPAFTEGSSLLRAQPSSSTKKIAQSALSKAVTDEQQMLNRRRTRRGLLRTAGQAVSIILCSLVVILLVVVTRRHSSSDSTSDSVSGSFTVSNFYSLRDGAFATEYVIAIFIYNIIRIIN
jgi:hypothetical protein